MLVGTLVGGAAQWLRTWALEPHGLRVCPGSGVTWSKLLDFFVPQFPHFNVEVMLVPYSYMG